MSKTLLANHRKESGKLLQNDVKIVSDNDYKIKSSDRKNTYHVIATKIGWVCSCPDHIFRGVKCKHIYAVEFSHELRKSVERIEEVVFWGCKYCKSERVVKGASATTNMVIFKSSFAKAVKDTSLLT